MISQVSAPNRPTARSYVAVFCLAFAPRLVYLLLADQPFQEYHWSLAGSLLHDGSLSTGGVKTTALEPLYPLFLAAVRALTNDRETAIRVAQAALASLGAVCLYRLADVLTGRRRVAGIAALLFAVNPLLIRHAADGTESALVTTLLVAFASDFVTATSPAHAARAGLWLGLAVLTRAMTLPLVVLGAALLAASGRRRQALALAAVTVVVIAPYGIRNYRLNGWPVPTRSGLNLFVSNCEYASSMLPDYGLDPLQGYAASVLYPRGVPDQPGSPLLEREEDKRWTAFALAEMTRRPLTTIWLKVRNVGYFFSPQLVPTHEPTVDMRIELGTNGHVTIANSPPRPLSSRVAYAVSYTPVLTLAIVGVYRRRRDLRRDAVLWCVVLTFVAAHAVFFPATRYRVPMEFVLLFYAAVAIDRLASRNNDGHRR